MVKLKSEINFLQNRQKEFEYDIRDFQIFNDIFVKNTNAFQNFLTKCKPINESYTLYD